MLTLSQISEKDFIRETLSKYAHTASVERFEDCVIIDLSEALGLPGLPHVVYNIDHVSRIRRPLSPDVEWRFYGRRIAGVTSSDVLAMGARPRGFSLDLAVPLDTPVGVVEQMYQGISDVLSQYGARMEGGNVDADDHLQTVGMCWGVVNQDAIIRRSGASVGDWVVVTSELGIGWASYLLDLYGRFGELDGPLQEMLRGYNLTQTAPSEAILETADQHGVISSGMDLTDGLIDFLYTIHERNGWGVRVYEDLIPVPHILAQAAILLGVPPTMLALDPGYDTPRAHGYTISPGRWSDVQRIFARHGAAVYHIGEVTEESGISWVDSTGRVHPIPGYWDDQFRKADLVTRWLKLVEGLR